MVYIPYWIWNVGGAQEWDFTAQIVWCCYALAQLRGNTGLQPLIVWLVHSLSEDNTCLCFATCKRNTQTCFNLRPICFVDEPGVARRKSLFLLLRPRVAEPCTSAELPVATKQRINAWHVLSADWPLHKCFALSKSDALAPGSCDTSFYWVAQKLRRRFVWFASFLLFSFAYILAVMLPQWTRTFATSVQLPCGSFAWK